MKKDEYFGKWADTKNRCMLREAVFTLMGGCVSVLPRSSDDQLVIATKLIFL